MPTLALFLLAHPAAAESLVSVAADVTLTYAAANERGDRIPDFSACGFRGGDRPIPDVPVRVTVRPGSGDDTARVQAAIDEAGTLDWTDGYRGTVLLEAGTYRIGGTLKLRKSGVVLRGAGADADTGTVLLATGGAGQKLIDARGSDYDAEEQTAVPITDAVVPVGATTLSVASAENFPPGTTIEVRRHGNADWIAALGMDRIAPRPDGGEIVQWKPFTLTFDRVVTAVEGNRLTLDAPITCAVEDRWGGGEVVRYSDDRRLEKVGVENLLCRSDFDTSVLGRYEGLSYYADEDHAAEAIRFGHVRNAWVRRVEARHFTYGLLRVFHSKWVTAAECRCLDPVSRIEGGRRYSFTLDDGAELCLVRGCDTRYGRHDFVFGSRVCGPNVFLRCTADRPLAHSEPHQRWAVGGLYDNVTATIAVQDRWNWGTGHGWAGANFVLWNCTGPLVLQQPPTAQNYAFGHLGEREQPFQDRPGGYVESFGRHVEPGSLYEAQRAGKTDDE